MKTGVAPLRRLFTEVIPGSWGSDPDEGELVARCIRGTDFDYPHLTTDGMSAPLRGFKRPELASKALRPGDLVIEKSGGGDQQPVGRAVLYIGDELAVPTNFAGGLRPANDVDPRFCCYLLSSLYRSGHTRAAIKQTTGIQNLDLGFLLTAAVPKPSLPEQRAIADYLDAETARIDALIAKKQALVARLLERRVALTLDGVSGRLRGKSALPLAPANLPWLDERPSYWSEAKLNLVATLGSGHTPSRDHPEWWVECSIPWITTGEVAQVREDRVEVIADTRERISELGIANSSAVVHPAGTVVLSRTASAGFSAIMGADMATSQDFVTWTCGPLLEPRYLLLCLRAMRQDLLGRLAQGSTHKTIYMPDIESICVPLPPLAEQQEIVELTWRELRRIDSVHDSLARQISLLAERRQALITAAVTGEMRVPGVAAAG